MSNLNLKNIYKEIIIFNAQYLEMFNSKTMIDKRRKDRLNELTYSEKIKEIWNSVLMRNFWREVNSTKNNINFYDKNNSCPHYEKGDKVAVYSCIVGNYDKLLEPFFVDPDVDYFIFTDLDIPLNSAWKKIDISKFDEYQTLSPTELNRKIKILAHKYLKGYKYTIYIDGVIKLMVPIIPWIEELENFGLAVHYHNTRDCIYQEAKVVEKLKRADGNVLKKQIAEYKEEGYPFKNGMYENTVLIRNSMDIETNKLMEKWWEEYQKYPTRDQISLPYVIWKENYERKKVYILGNNLNMNPRMIRELRHN